MVRKICKHERITINVCSPYQLSTKFCIVAIPMLVMNVMTTKVISKMPDTSMLDFSSFKVVNFIEIFNILQSYLY